MKLKLHTNLDKPEEIALLNDALEIYFPEEKRDEYPLNRVRFLRSALRAVCAAIVRHGKRPQWASAYAVDVREETREEFNERRAEERRYGTEAESGTDPKTSPRFQIRFDQN
jgi:hypothetical protein